MSGLHFHPLRVTAVRADTADAAVVSLAPADGDAARWQFQPGQHLTLRAVVDGQEQRRSYSLCAAPGEALCVGVRRVPGGVFSGWLHEQLRPGMHIDALPPQDMPIPADDKHRHFGKGQTETMLTLPPGKHTLQLLLGDRNHVPHRPPVMSDKVTITVLP